LSTDFYTFYSNSFYKYIYEKEGGIMPEHGRKKVMDYLKENNVTITSLASTWNIPVSKMSQYLSGKDTSPKANEIILKIIDAYGIR
jgi:hypothetical protein